MLGRLRALSYILSLKRTLWGFWFVGEPLLETERPLPRWKRSLLAGAKASSSGFEEISSDGKENIGIKGLCS